MVFVKVLRSALCAGAALSGIVLVTEVSSVEHAATEVVFDASVVEGCVVRAGGVSGRDPARPSFGSSPPTYLADIRPSGPMGVA